MKTYMAKTGEIAKKWYVVDMSEKVLGRAATRIATILMGKHRPEYTPHVDCGDFVIVVNAEKIKLTGARKGTERIYHQYSGYPGGLKEITLDKMLSKRPARVVSEAIRRMLPKSKLGRAMLKKLKVYPGPDHPHQAQNPEVLEL